jgi:hypothetical protein
MANSKLILTAAIAALILGGTGFAATAAERAPTQDGILLAADDSAQGAAKTGQDQGTPSGEDQGAAPEDETQGPAAGGEDDQGEDDAMPPPEDEDEGAPSDEGNQD